MRLFLLFALFTIISAPSYAQTKRIVALGDSLTSGYGLEAGEDFASRLQVALIAGGMNVKIENAGVSGDTSAGGLARLAWSIEGDTKPDLVIVALGSNDLLRGIDPKVTRDNLSKILATLQEKDIPAFLVGMKSPTNMGPLFQSRFDKTFKELAKEYNVPFYPFFLEGVVMQQDLNLPDGIHPNAKGIDVIVEKILPFLKKALE